MTDRPSKKRQKLTFFNLNALGLTQFIPNLKIQTGDSPVKCTKFREMSNIDISTMTDLSKVTVQ